MTILDEGRYSLIYSNGEYRTIRVKKARKGSPLEGKIILAIKEGHHYQGAGFLNAGNKIAFWSRFRRVNNQQRLDRIQRAVDVVASDPRKAQLAFAMKEHRCARCGKDLTVPASIHNGLGPECAKKGHWTKADQLEAFEAQKESAA